MKLQAKLNSISVTVLLAMTVLIVLAGMFIIEDIIVEMNRRLLRSEVSNVIQKIRWSLQLRSAGESQSKDRTHYARRFLLEHLRSHEFGETGMLFIIARPDRTVFAGGPLSGVEVDKQSADTMFRRKQGFINLSLNNTPYLGAFAVFPDWDWLIVQTVSAREMFEKRTEYLTYVSILGLLILGLCVLVSSVSVSRLVDRIKTTLGCVQAVEEGDLTSRIRSIGSDDEIGNLQRGLNSMISTIERRTREQERVQEALLASEEKYRSIFENSIEGIYQSSPAGRFLSANPAMARILGFDTPEEVLLAYTDIRTQLYVNPEDRDDLQALFNGPGRAEGFETRMYRKTGEVIWVSITAYIVRDPAGKPLYYEGILQDITEEKRVYEALEDEKRFIEGALDTLTDVFLVFDLNGRFQRWNKTVTKVTGFSDHEIASMGPMNFFSADEGRKAIEAIQKIYQEGHATFEASVLLEETANVAYEFTGDLLRDGHGNPSNICVVGRDITERKEAERRIQEQNDFLRTVLESLTHPFYVIDARTYEILMSNSAAGIPPSVKTTCYRMTHGNSIPCGFAGETCPVLEVRKTRRPVTVEHTHRTKNGDSRDFEIRAYPILDGAGEVVQVIEYSFDVTDRKRAEQEIRRLNEELEQRVANRTAELEAANRELKDFAYVVSHDLKAPLRAINQLAGWIADDYGDALGRDGRMQVELLVGRVRRMHGLIEGILQYSRIGRVREKEREIDLDYLVRDVIDLVAPPPGIEVIIEDRLPIVTGEPTRLNQLFQNLLDNSIKYMDKTSGKVIIGCLEEQNQWKFRISDNGPGIDEKYFDKVFKIFQTLTPRDQSESTGIGLALVKRIVEIRGGKIWVESQLGHGTTFFFTLPKRGERK